MAINCWLKLLQFGPIYNNFRENVKNILEKYIMKNIYIDFTELKRKKTKPEIIYELNHPDDNELGQITFKKKKL